MTTPTPRTDAAVASILQITTLPDHVEADFARQLERDLAAALEELAALRAELASVKSHADLMRVELLRFGTVAAEAARIAHDANEAALTYRAAHPKDAP